MAPISNRSSQLPTRSTILKSAASSPLVNGYHKSRYGDRWRDKIIKCYLTEKGMDERGNISGDFLHFEGEFDLEKSQY